MKKKFKKVMLAVLSASMLIGLAGCGSKGGNEVSKEESKSSQSTESSIVAETVDKEKDPVTLEWYYRGNGQQQDTRKVEDHVNELLKEYPGLEHVTVHFNCYTAAEYQQQVTLAQSAGKQMDILNTVSLSNWKQEVENGSFMPITDLISEDLKAVLPQWIWDLGSLEGEIYMVPNYQGAGNLGYLFTPKEYEAYGDANALRAVLSNPDSTLQEIADAQVKYLLEVREGLGSNTKYLQSLADHMFGKGTQGYYYTAPYDILHDNFIVVNGTGKVVERTLGDTAKELYALMADWYDAGYIHPDIMTVELNELRFANMLNPVSFVLSQNGAIGTEEYNNEIYSTNWGFDVDTFRVQAHPYYMNNWAAGGNGISSTCEHPEEAIRFIEALTTGTEKGKEIYNTVVFGLEGVHYVKDANDPDRIETLEYTGSQGGVDTSYAGLKWIIGNTFNAYKNQAVTEETTKFTMEFNEDPDAVASDLLGFYLKTEAVQTQLEQIKAVNTEYYASLKNGVLGKEGWEKAYNEYEQKMKIAGVDEVLEEFQRQVDEFLASRK